MVIESHYYYNCRCSCAHSKCTHHSHDVIVQFQKRVQPIQKICHANRTSYRRPHERAGDLPERCGLLATDTTASSGQCKRANVDNDNNGTQIVCVTHIRTHQLIHKRRTSLRIYYRTGCVRLLRVLTITVVCTPLTLCGQTIYRHCSARAIRHRIVWCAFCSSQSLDSR